MTTALVLGANGQDGSYLSEILCARGQDVVGVGRQPRPRWPVSSGKYRYQTCDISDTDTLQAILRLVSPDIVFHFAAIHGAAGFDYESVWREVQLVNTVSVHAVLEYIRGEKPSCGLVYASSAKVFGAPLPARISETTPRKSSCIYSITKNAGHALIDYYRARHAAKASVLYLFNHESPRRAPEFFIPRLAEALKRALLDGGKSEIYSLDFCCDWGDAREYMEIAADIAERALGEDFVLATGKTWTGREMAGQLFARHGLDLADHLIETAPASSMQSLYQASNAKLRARLGRAPMRSILDVFDEFLQAAL
ncbi:MAG TPA: GDP-mannose 4,6-dehydratase [Rhizomicrobium sp.]|jgi:GDPmannose 4,6-dehydratase|nr:GDP-mannose 4,6-dehydratase [Rhizomicrobium sp.]